MTPPLLVSPPRWRSSRPPAGLLAPATALLWLTLLLAPGASVVDAQPPPETAGSLPAQVDARADATLAEGLRRRYQEIEAFDDLEVSVRAGVVTLGGSILSETARDEALGLARRVEGVVRVEDQIEVIVDPRQRLRPALDDAFERLRLLVSYLPLLAVAMFLIAIFVVAARLVGRWRGLFARVSDNRFAQDLVRQAVMAAILLTGILIALEILDATALVGAVLGAAGVIGLALGFAFRDLVENYVSSILLSIRQPFAPNDHVDIDGNQGKVVRLTSRATILMTLDGNHVRIPNAQVFKGIVLNYSRNPRRRFDFGVGVGVGEDLTHAQQLGIGALNDMPGVLDEPAPAAMIEEMGDSNVLIRFYGWVDQREASFGKVKSEAIRRVKTVLEDAGMDLPEPIYRVHLVPSATVPPDGAEPADADAPASKSSKAPPRDAEPPALDLEPDDDLTDQIAEDRAHAGDGADLLDPGAPTE